jgi:SAM-dependent methyltransferase
VTLEESHYWDTVIRAWNRTQPQRLWRCHSDAINVALFAPWLPKGRVQRLLKTDAFDEAVGHGLYPLLESKAEQVVSLDISISSLRTARSRYTGLHVVRADVRHLPFTNGVFDVVVSSSTLDHFATPEDIVISLCELRRVLCDSGLLLLTLDNLANPAIVLRNALPFRLLNRLGIVPYYVGATCGPRGLRCLLEQAGFEVLDTRAVLHCPRVLAVAAARLLERYAKPGTQGRFLRFLMAFEHLSRWPIRFVTGYFVAVRAIKPAVDRSPAPLRRPGSTQTIDVGQEHKDG